MVDARQRAMTEQGRLYAGTSGFSYPAWSPAFYPAGLRRGGRLGHYAARLGACELNATYYRRPTPAAVRRWTDAVPAGFRFVVKGQRSAAYRAMTADPTAAVGWLVEPLPAFGDRLGAVLFRVDGSIARDNERLAALLAAWPAGLPLCLELRHPSWTDDEVHARLREAGASLCATDVDDAPEPDLRVTGSFVYVRLRRETYDDEAIERWAARLAPFLAAGHDVFAFFRHDERGAAGLRAEALQAAVSRIATMNRDPGPRRPIRVP